MEMRCVCVRACVTLSVTSDDVLHLVTGSGRENLHQHLLVSSCPLQVKRWKCHTLCISVCGILWLLTFLAHFCAHSLAVAPTVPWWHCEVVSHHKRWVGSLEPQSGSRICLRALPSGRWSNPVVQTQNVLDWVLNVLKSWMCDCTVKLRSEGIHQFLYAAKWQD